jgi:UTP--glucose-1-phosphate uridylyltransferase
MKAVIPAAGLGTRLLPATKEQPKEMLAVFSRSGGQLFLKPLLQLVFEQLYDVGFREFCFVIGRGKRSIEDHFTPDYGFVDLMAGKGRNEIASDLEKFYKKVESSTIVWVNQPAPLGFGDAVLRARHFVGKERMLVHAGDTYVVSDSHGHLRRLIKTHEKLAPEATLVLQRLKDPRQYGVTEVEKTKTEGLFRITRAIEKPEKPPTNLAIMPIYIFEPSIFRALEKVPPGKGGELQLTDAFQKLIKEGKNVYGLLLTRKEMRLDIGTTQTYWEALEHSYRYAAKR